MIRPTHLQFLAETTLTNVECRERHARPPYTLRIHNETLCAFTRVREGACHGDSGGPLAVNGQLVGVVSWGRPCANGFPDQYMRISSYTPWIQQVTGVVAA